MKQVLILSFSFTVLSAAAQSGNYEKQKAVADSLYEEKEYSKALSIYQKLLKENPKDGSVLNQTGIIYYNENNFNKAKESFRLAALYCPVDDKSTLANYYSNLSAAFSNLNENEKAYEYAMKAYVLDDDEELTTWNAASNAQNVGKYDECLKIMDNAKITKHIGYLTLYGRCYLNKKEYEKAIESYESFFTQYSEATSKVNFNIASEKMNLFYSYMGYYMNIHSQEKNVIEYKEKFKHLAGWLAQNGRRSELLAYLHDYDNDYWMKNETLKQIYAELMEGIPDLQQNEKIEVAYRLGNFKEAYDIAEKEIMTNTEEAESGMQEIKLYRYLAYLQLLLTDYLQNGNKMNNEKLARAKLLYDGLYKKNIDYNTSEDFGDLIKNIQSTFQIFTSHFKTKEQQKQIAPYVFEILKDTPDKKVREFLIELKNKGVLKN